MVPQVHVVGDGVVGKAASTGSHQWILRDACNDYGSVSKDFAELNHQFLAGIQTIAVIPVLPRGVLQLGSTQMVMETIGFVNDVRNLFAQLGCVTGALLSDITKKALTQNSQLYDGIAPIASEVLPDKLTITTTKLRPNDSFQPMIHPVGKPILHLNSQLESRPVGAQVIFPNPDTRSMHPALSHDLTSKYQDQPSVLTSGLSSNSLPFLEQLLAMSSIRSWESINNSEPALDNSKTLHLRAHGCMFSDSPKDSSIISLFGRSETSENANGLGRFRSLPGDTTESTRISYANSSSTEAAQMLNQRNHSKSSLGISVDPCPSHSSINDSQSVLTAGKQKKENDLIQDCDVPSTQFDVNGPHYWTLSSTPHECRLSSSNTVQKNQRFHNAFCNANDTNAAQSKQNMKDNDESKLPYIFPVQTTSEVDLYDVLGPDYKIDDFGGSLDDVFVHKGDASVHELSAHISTCTTQLDVCPISHSLNDGISGAEMFSVADADQLLDAVISNINSGAKQNSDDNVSSMTSTARISSSSLPSVPPNYGLIASSKQMKGDSFGRSLMLGKAEEAGSSSVKSARNLGNITEECSQSSGVYKSQISLWVESGQSMKCDNLSGTYSKTVAEIGKLNWRRARHGENPRPRPKDRQMIMDRVKELREIVPNGGKCSIDALLEKTIKHMLFLQSMTKHADKLKDIGEPKFINKEGDLLLKENFEGGVTWAFEVGTQSMTCPIIVEDLNPPRQLLVEMLCEQLGFFLEIADLIRGLGLTILKGVMEARKDKIWARFAVEANRDVTRIEIFLSLVRLLEPTVGSHPMPQGVDNGNMPHNMHHRSCIPATGTSDRLR